MGKAGGESSQRRHRFHRVYGDVIAGPLAERLVKSDRARDCAGIPPTAT
jgi:hypothetical protein